MTTKIERAPSLTTTSRVQPTAPSQAAAPVEVDARPSSPSTAFSGEGPRRDLNPAGGHVTRSADPEALWGDAGPRRGRGAMMAEFKRLPPAERAAKLEALKAQREALKGEIQERVGELDRRWRYARLKTRTASMRDLQAKRPELSPEAAAKLDAALKAAEQAEAKVNALAEKAKAFTPESKKDPVQAAARKALASELRKAREAHSQAVAAATAIIDEAGLKVDRLANAEQLIDKNAPPPGSGKSLWDKVVSFFDLGWAIATFTSMVKWVTEEQERLHEQRVEQDKADREIDYQLRKQRERDREKADDSARLSRAEQLKALLA
ncbi:MAG: hypothetical protein AB1938_09690 [Myxococcota bacterium]